MTSLRMARALSLAWVTCVLSVGLGTTACSGAASTCNAATCGGCCTPSGICETFPSTTFCGLGGAACQSCGAAQWCEEGLCVSPGTDSGTQDGGGSDAGGRDSGMPHGCGVNGCPADATCGGDDQCHCNTGYHACGTDCFDDNSVDTCGQSCNACPTAPFGQATCDGVSCGIACDTGYRACGSTCIPSGQLCWSYEASIPGVTLNAVWGSGSADIYAVGTGGAILHSVGDGNWSQQSSGTTQDLYAVWGSGPQDVYAVGNAYTVLHSTGNGSWSVETTDNTSFDRLTGVWGSYAVEDHSSQMLVRDGGAWSGQLLSANFPDLFAIWGTGHTAVAVGSDGDLGAECAFTLQPDGGWTEASVAGPSGGVLDYLASVWGVASNDVYADDSTHVFHFDGTSWTAQALPNGVGGLDAVGGADSTHLFAAGYNETVLESDGSGTWTQDTVPAGTDTNEFQSIWASSATDVFVVGYGLTGGAGVVLRGH